MLCHLPPLRKVSRVLRLSFLVLSGIRGRVTLSSRPWALKSLIYQFII